MFTPDELAITIEKECENLPLNREPKGLFEPIRYIMKDGGKRMRPILSLLSANIFNNDITSAMGSALSIEIFHNFTLLHDDIMDKAPLRRGRPTVHVRWDENTAILSGDAMVPLAYSILSERSDPNMLPLLVSEFNKVTLEVCKGQQYDMNFEKQTNVTKEEYKEMIRLKTAVLMASGMKMAAIAVGASKEQHQAIYDFGINLGIAFQIQDDLLDTYGNYATFGKTIGGDISVGKQTFLMICAKERANSMQSMVLFSSRNFDEVKNIYDILNIKESANEAVEYYFENAMKCLENCSDDPQRLILMKEYAMNLLKRKK